MSNTQIVPIDKTGERVDPGAVHTARPVWVNIATSASASDEPLDIGVAARGPNGKATYQLAKALQIAGLSGDEKIAIYDIPRSWNGIRLRAEGITADGTYTTQVYFGTLGDGNLDSDLTSADCELAYFGQCAWVIGTQASITSGYEMADAVTVTESDWPTTVTTKSPAAERVAETNFDLLGADVIVVVPTVVSADCKLKARGY